MIMENCSAFRWQPQRMGKSTIYVAKCLQYSEHGTFDCAMCPVGREAGHE